MIGLGLVVATPLSGIIVGIIGIGKQLDRLVERRKKVLQPLYGMAQSLDADIAHAFLYDDFEQNRERFGPTYRSLSGEERAGVDRELHQMLAAGALDMGEAELDRYLSGLREEEVAPDA